ncbi:MAG TPA: hypothetical protein VIC62_15485 [Nakamurella sp.]
MGYLVRTITAMQLRLGDVVIPDKGPRQHVTQHRIQGAHPVVVVQYAADPGCPWVHPTASGNWIDFDAIPTQMGALSGGEQRFLQIAAALDDGDTTVNLGRCLAGLDRTHVHLVLAAVAHAAGTHQHEQLTFRPDGAIKIDRPGSMYRRDQPPGSVSETPCRGGGINR